MRSESVYAKILDITRLNVVERRFVFSKKSDVTKRRFWFQKSFFIKNDDELKTYDYYLSKLDIDDFFDYCAVNAPKFTIEVDSKALESTRGIVNLAWDVFCGKTIIVIDKNNYFAVEKKRELPIPTSTADTVLSYIKELINLEERFLLEDEKESIQSEVKTNKTESKTQNEDEEKSEIDLNAAEEAVLKNIIGHDEHVKEIFKKIKRKMLRLSTDKRSPISFFMAGPTGTGKTELAIQVSNSLSYPLLRVDMSEYMDKHNIARLIGAPPGYAGYGNPSLLRQCHEKEYLIILDEFEKAHSDIQHTFLQVLDYGILTDGENNQIDLSRAIIFFTSNVGAAEVSAAKIGLNLSSEKNDKNDKISTIKKAISRALTPEFLNRLTALLIFSDLSDDVIRKILLKRLIEIKNAVHTKYGVIFNLDEGAISSLLKESSIPGMGIRPMHRAIEKLLLEPVSEFIYSNDRSRSIVIGDGNAKLARTVSKPSLPSEGVDGPVI